MGVFQFVDQMAYKRPTTNEIKGLANACADMILCKWLCLRGVAANVRQMKVLFFPHV